MPRAPRQRMPPAPVPAEELPRTLLRPRRPTPAQPRTGTALDAGVPFRMARVASLHDVEVARLQALGHGAHLAVAHRAIVDLANGGHLRCGAGEEGLVREVELIARDALLENWNPLFVR